MRPSLAYRRRLWDDPGPLWREGAVSLALTPSFSPASMRLGATAELRPLTVLALSGGVFFGRWYGTFDLLQDFASARDDHSDSAIEDGAARGRAFATSGREAELRAVALGKVGSVAVRNDLLFTWADYDLRDPGASLFYDPRTDLMHPDAGWSLVNESDVVYLGPHGLVAGARASVGHAFYRPRDFRPGEPGGNPNTPHVRVGPLLAWRLREDPADAAFNHPTLILIAQWWVDHRFRTGADTSAALPYGVLAFRFDGRLWSRE